MPKDDALPGWLAVAIAIFVGEPGRVQGSVTRET